MARQNDPNRSVTDIVAVQPPGEVTVLPPDSGVIGRFLEETMNMFKARAMRLSSQLRRINESGQRTETMLRMAAERMEAAESKLEEHLRKEGLLPESDCDVETNDSEEE